MSDIPDWAFNRVVELAGCEPVIPDDKPHVAHQRAFARYIAEHEEPPVDPVEDALREAWKQALSVYHGTHLETHLDKGAQDTACVNRFRAVLSQRGIEIGEGK